MIAACGYQCLRLYDIVNPNNPTINYDGIQKNYTRLGFQEDGTWMYTCGEDGKVRIWDMQVQQSVRSFDCSSPINSACLHPNQVEIAIASQSGGVFLWNVNSKAHEHYIPETNASVQDVAISPDGKFMAAVNNRGKCYVWDLKSSPDQTLSVAKGWKVFSILDRYGLRVKFCPNSKYMVTCSSDETARIWSVPDFELVRELKKPNCQWVWDAAFSSDRESKYLFTASSDGIARLWSWKHQGNPTVVREYCGHTKAITALAFKDEIIPDK